MAAFSSARVLALAVLLGCAPEPTEQATPDYPAPQDLWVFDKDGEPAVLVSVTTNICWQDYYEVTFAAWCDGRVVWSEDLQRGGKPFHFGALSQKQIELETNAIGDRVRLVASHTGPGVLTAMIGTLGRHGSLSRQQRFEFEEGRPANDVEVADRRTWGEVRESIASLVHDAALANPFEFELHWPRHETR